MSEHPASVFDEWYGTIAASDAFDRAVAQGLDLPTGVVATGLVTGPAFREVLQALALAPHEVLLDLGCGRGSYGLAAARATHARLVGVDFSAVAVELARSAAERLGQGEHARFLVGDLAATGLEPASVDAVMCLDSIQFASSTQAAVEECRRVLVPGGRLVFTCWQAAGPGADQLPERIRQLDLASALTKGGFTDVAVLARPSWLDHERRHWEAAVSIDLQDDAGLIGLREEAEQLLPLVPKLRRVLATAVAPAGPG